MRWCSIFTNTSHTLCMLPIQAQVKLGGTGWPCYLTSINKECKIELSPLNMPEQNFFFCRLIFVVYTPNSLQMMSIPKPNNSWHLSDTHILPTPIGIKITVWNWMNLLTVPNPKASWSPQKLRALQHRDKSLAYLYPSWVYKYLPVWPSVCPVHSLCLLLTGWRKWGCAAGKSWGLSEWSFLDPHPLRIPHL